MSLGNVVKYVEDPQPKWKLVPIESYKLKAGDFVALPGWTDGHDPTKEKLVLEVQKGGFTTSVLFDSDVEPTFFRPIQKVKVVRSVSPPDVRADKKADMNARLELNLLPYLDDYR